MIDGWIEADREAPRKQRHTARRIWQRLVAEHGAEVSERQVCRYVHPFVMRACFSGAGFVIAFRNESQQAFLEAHVAAFEWFGGVFDLVRYDNLKAAVAQVLKGRRRVESDRFVRPAGRA